MSGDDQALSGRENHRWRHQLTVASSRLGHAVFSIPEASDRMTTQRTIETYLMDMDGVLVHEERLIPGADQFIKRLQQTGHRFLLLTNNSIYTPRDLAARLTATGLQVPEQAIWTSALATARFLDTQRPQGSAYVIGEAGLTTALHERGYVLSDRDPDYVVLGETRAYSTEAITRAIRLIDAGARFIATNPDPTGPSPAGLQPATGAVAALISKATGVKPYFVGKPNPLMMREALRAIDAHSETTVMIGDRMDTDIVAGMEAGLQTILVLTGITSHQEAQRFPFLPSRIVDSVADLVDDIGDEPKPAGWPPARQRTLRQVAADHVGPSAPNGQPLVRAANAS